ncbi:hypothetical protein SPAN111604_03590 [Sphingomonas antarctica]|uniref:hypothetical protein n=1 Tax=Sphingomonas antarctica TaxID=2040274 RepID=UPI0039ED38F2
MTDNLQDAADLTKSAIAALDRAEADVPAAMLDHALHIINELIETRSRARAAAN